MDKHNNKLNSTFSAHFDPNTQEKISDSITKFNVSIMYEGKNRNGSYFTREVMDKMSQKIGGIPVIGHYSEEQQDFLAHGELVMTMSNDGTVDAKHVGPVPYGFVPLGAKTWYENKLDKDGETRNYLFTEAYLWTGKYAELEVLKDGLNNQSMELSNMTGSWDLSDGSQVFHVEDAAFDGLCILGKGVEPCFEGAGLSAVNQFSAVERQRFSATFSAMKEELEKTLQTNDKEEYTMSKDLETEVEKTEEFEVVEPTNEEEVKPEVAEEVTEEETEVEDNNDESEGLENSDEEEEVEKGLDELEGPTEEELAAIEANAEEEVALEDIDEDLVDIKDLLSDFQRVVTENEALVAEVASLKEQLSVYTKAELNSLKQSTLDKFKEDLHENSYNEIQSNFENLTVDEIEKKAVASAYASLKARAEAANMNKETNFELSTEDAISGANAVVATVNEDFAKKEFQKTTPSWVDRVLEVQNGKV